MACIPLAAIGVAIAIAGTALVISLDELRNPDKVEVENPGEEYPSNPEEAKEYVRSRKKRKIRPVFLLGLVIVFIGIFWENVAVAVGVVGAC